MTRNPGARPSPARSAGLAAIVAAALLSHGGPPPPAGAAEARSSWKAGVAKAVVTPDTSVWLAGYGTKRPPDGKLHDLWVKALALEDGNGDRAVLITSDFQGVPKSMSDRVFEQLRTKHGLARRQVMLTFSHNHCGPRLGDDLVDYYPVEPEQEKLVEEYTSKMVDRVVATVVEAVEKLAPASLKVGEGKATFAVNRRNNREADVPALLASKTPLAGPVDHSVPVMTVTRPDGSLAAVLFGYACHPTTLNFNTWCGDYPGFAQAELEKAHPGAVAMFVNTCGGDQNPLPRRTVALCERYGHMLATAVEEALARPMKPLSPALKTAFEYVALPYLKVVTRDELAERLKDPNAILARWAARMLRTIDADESFGPSYAYPIHAWRLGEQTLLIGLGAEAVVDYALRFKREFGPGTWVCGYADDMIAYIPSRRVWEEGGYEGGSNLYEYGRPAFRWAGDVEDRIAATTRKLVAQVGGPAGQAARPAEKDTGFLSLRIEEIKGGLDFVPAPARVHLVGPGGKPVLAPGLPSFRDHFNCDRFARLELPAGRYTYEVERGPEYSRRSGSFTIAAGKVHEQRVIMARLAEMSALGWYSGDTHVHRPPDDIPLLLRSEDLNVAPVITVWNKNNYWKDRPHPERPLVEADATHIYDLFGCEDERRGGALLYFNLSRPLDFSRDGPEVPSPVAHLREALEQDGAWVDVEKPFWWDAPTWVATGRVRSIELANNHMCRSSMLDNEAWGRPRDRNEFPSPRGNGFYTQALYYRLLNCGQRIPPSAGSASGVLPNPVGYNRAYVHIDGPFSHEAWWRGLGEGRSFVTNGPLLRVQANNQHPGAVFRSTDGRPVSVELDVRIVSNDPIEAIEIVRDGKVVERITQSSKHKLPQGKYLTLKRDLPQPSKLTFERSGWFLVRCIAAVPETFRFASTAPFYVEVGGRPSTIHRGDVQFFLDWIDERIGALERDAQGQVGGPERKEAVLAPHREARRFFERLLAQARED